MTTESDSGRHSFAAYSGWTGYDLRGRHIGEVRMCPMCKGKLSIENRPSEPLRGLLLSASVQPLYTESIAVNSSAWRTNFDVPNVNIEPFRLLRCPQCRWWGIEERGAETDNKDYWYGFHFLVSAVCQWHDYGNKDIPVSALRELFEKQRDVDFTRVHPWAFERLVAECLRSEFGPCEVHHVGAHGGGGDGGIDIYMVKDTTTWLVQVKRRLNDKSESVDTIRLINGVLLREGKNHAMVVTSAAAFTLGAIAETRVKTPGPYVIDLIDRGGVMEMLSKVPCFDLDHFLQSQYPEVRMCPMSDALGALLKTEES